MAEEKEIPDRIEQAREAFLYAPLGLIYEYDTVIPQLVRRGKSQVQLAKMVGKMATNRDQVEKGVTDGVSSLLAKGFVEFGQLLGLAPDTDCKPEKPTGKSSPGTPAEDAKAANTPNEATPAKAAKASKTDKVKATTNAKAVKDPKPSKTLPIAGYDSLNAKDIVRLLDDLSAAQRKTIRAHEETNRARKTILSKLDRLDK